MSDLIDKVSDKIFNARQGEEVFCADEIISLCLDELKEKTLSLKAVKHDRRAFLQIIEDMRND